MNLLDSLIKKTVPYLPKWFSKLFASPYVAGETVEEALINVSKLNRKGFQATLDILGEHVYSPSIASNITEQYCTLYQRINDKNLNCTISVKPSHVGLNISYQEALKNFKLISNKAKDFGNFLRIDMENSDLTDQTFNLYNECKQITQNVGVAMQAYLKRSINDMHTFADSNFNARICKGIYKEHSSIAFKSRASIKNNFIAMAKIMAEKGSFAGFATHDQELIDELLNWIRAENISKDKFEFQALYGVPMDGRLERLIDYGYSVRIYVPFGPDWFDYSIRRLEENPNIAKYVLKNFFKNG